MIELDPDFYKQQINLRIAEICYKLNNIDESFRTIEKVEDDLRDTDKYMLYLLKGKCYDKIRHYAKAAEEYKLALKASAVNNLDSEVLGQIEFRLGWSIIRSKIKVVEGIEHLQKSSELCPDNTEIMVKLAGVLFQEKGSDEKSV